MAGAPIGLNGVKQGDDEIPKATELQKWSTSAMRGFGGFPTSVIPGEPWRSHDCSRESGDKCAREHFDF